MCSCNTCYTKIHQLWRNKTGWFENLKYQSVNKTRTTSEVNKKVLIITSLHTICNVCIILNSKKINRNIPKLIVNSWSYKVLEVVQEFKNTFLWISKKSLTHSFYILDGLTKRPRSTEGIFRSYVVLKKVAIFLTRNNGFGD